MEARQLQQTLIVKQDELTRLNRDNEHLLTEARLLLKEDALRRLAVGERRATQNRFDATPTRTKLRDYPCRD